MPRFRSAPQPMPGWGPISPPTRPKKASNWLIREAVIFSGLGLVCFWAGAPTAFPWGLITVTVARGILAAFVVSPNRLHTAGAMALAGLMAFLLAGKIPDLPNLETVKAPKLEVPQVGKAQSTDWGKVFEQWKAEFDKANKKEAAK